MQVSCGIRFLVIKGYNLKVALPHHHFPPPARSTTVAFRASSAQRRRIRAGASEGGPEEGAMVPPSSAGFPLRFPNPWLAGAVAFGLGQLYILALNDALLPAALRALYYSIVGDNATARTITVVATAVHVVEGGVALGVCLKRRYALTATLYWTLLSFIFGFPGLLLLRQRPRYAIVGGGFAGVAAAWHLLSLTHPRAVDLDLYDAAGIAGGASGAAAGLLHPFSPKGKLLWRGEEAMQDALELLAVANAHRDSTMQQHSRASHPTMQHESTPSSHSAVSVTEAVSTPRAAPSRLTSERLGETESGRAGTSGHVLGHEEGTRNVLGRISWAESLLRPAADARQAAAFSRLSAQLPGNSLDQENISGSSRSANSGSPRAKGGGGSQGASVRAVGVDDAVAAVPGLPEQALRSAVGGDLAGSAALWIEGSHVVHPARYLRALWGACEGRARSSGGVCRLVREVVTSLEGLEASQGPYAAVIVAAGAAAGVLPEIGDTLPMELCQGYTLDLAPPRTPLSGTTEEASASGHSQAEKYQGPSLLGSTYLAAQGCTHLVAGATKRYGLSSRQALEECGRAVRDPAEAAAAAAELLPRAAAVWPPVARWEVVGVRSGVRALPQRSAQGSLPLAGKLEGEKKWWVVAGLGARGLVYHAWLGRLIARAATIDDQSVLPQELRRWQRCEN